MPAEGPGGAGTNGEARTWASYLRVAAVVLALGGIIELAQEGMWDLLLRLGLIALFLLLVSRSLPGPLRVRLSAGAGVLALLAAIPAAIYGNIWMVVAALGISWLCFGNAFALSKRLPPVPLRARLSLGAGVVALLGAAVAAIYGDLLMAVAAVGVSWLFLDSARDLFKRTLARRVTGPE